MALGYDNDKRHIVHLPPSRPELIHTIGNVKPSKTYSAPVPVLVPPTKNRTEKTEHNIGSSTIIIKSKCHPTFTIAGRHPEKNKTD